MVFLYGGGLFGLDGGIAQSYRVGMAGLAAGEGINSLYLKEKIQAHRNLAVSLEKGEDKY